MKLPRIAIALGICVFFNSEQTLYSFQAKTFDLTSVEGLSDNQLEQHQKLYQGYVKKRNEIQQSLKTVDRSNVANITYSPFRALKVAETFALNGSLLHELYFEISVLALDQVHKLLS